MTARGDRAAGFTLVELMIVVGVVVPLLLVVGAASRAVTGAVRTNDAAAASAAAAVEAVAELEQVLRFGRVGSLEVRATEADVDANRAARVGDWFSMPSLEPRDDIQLRSLTGERDLALEPSFRLCGLRFVRDPRETVDGVDDDGDGLVDEGEIMLSRDGITTRLLDRVELCEFELDGQMLRLRLRYGRPGHGEGIRRTTIQRTVFLQNL